MVMPLSTHFPPPHRPDKRLAGLDHLRALAILLVFIYHYRIFGNPPLPDALWSFGWTGVDLFFVLSGYLIGGQLLGAVARGERISYREFYLKRFFRIIPAFLAVVLLYFTIPAFKERSNLPPLWKFLTFTQNFGLDLTTHGAFSHAWSLCIEEQFYLVLPLLLILLLFLPVRAEGADQNAMAGKDATTDKNAVAKYGPWLLAFFFMLGFAVRIYNWNHFIGPILQTDEQKGFTIAYYKWIYYPTYTRLDGLLAGVGLAALFHFQPVLWQRLTRHGNLLLGISLALLTGSWFLADGDAQRTFPAAVFGFPLISLAYGIMVLAALSPTCLLYRFPSRVTTLIATLSYSIYLTHKQLIHLTQVVLKKAGMDGDSYLVFWIAVGVSIIGGWLLHLAIERPFLQLRARVLKSKKTAPDVMGRLRS